MLLPTFIFCLMTTAVIVTGQESPSSRHHHVRRPPYKQFKSPHQNIDADLPRHVIPVHYTLHIRPILVDPVEENYTAPGQVQIVLECQQETNNVTVNTDIDMVVIEDSITLFQLNEDGSHGVEIEIFGTFYDPTDEFFTINLISQLLPGQSYELSMNFVARISTDAMAGLYMAQYQTPEGETRYMATTQFQGYRGARTAFPCFDEPGLKATFDISIGRQTEMNSLCNTSPKNVGVEDPSLPSGWVWDIYNRTMPMSTYLIAIIVSDFVCETADPSIFEGRPFRICGPAHQILDQQGATFTDAGARMMNFFEETLNYPYEMYKVDNAAIPRDYYGPGAMENWGLVTYRDDYVLWYEGHSSQLDKHLVWSIMAHELAHQWFGDLVTCADWTFLWLNEGFATYMETKYGLLAPEFDTVREILTDHIQVAMAYDVGRDEVVHNPELTSGGTIIYEKGASLLRMMEGFLGQQILYEAFAEYLRRYAYKPVTQDQFFDVVNEYAHSSNKIPPSKTIKQIMDSWTLQSGYPMVTVSMVDGQTVRIGQKKFLDLTTTQQPTDTLWEIPIAMAMDTNPNFSNHTPALWLNSSEQNWEFESSPQWLILNTDAMAFFRVLYDAQLLTQIHAQLTANLDNLSGQSRSQLMDDYFSFAWLGHEPIESALGLTKYLDIEEDHIVWYSVFRHLDPILAMLEDRPMPYFHPKIEAVVSRALANYTLPLNEVGIGSRVIWLAKMLDYTCAMEDTLGVNTPCRQLCLNLFQQWMDEPDMSLTDLMPPEFEPTILCHGVSQLGQTGLDFLISKYVTVDPSSLHKNRFYDALACAEPTVLQNFVQQSLSQLQEDLKVNTIDVPKLIKNLVSWPIHRSFVSILLLRDGALILAAAVRGERDVGEIVVALSRVYNDPVELEEFTSIVSILKPLVPTQAYRMELAVAIVEDNVKWMTTFESAMTKWFSDNTVLPNRENN